MDLRDNSRVPNVVGGAELVAKQSAVNAEGQLRLVPIDGLVFRQVRAVPHEDGHVTEVARASWPELVDPVVQVHLTTTFPGRIRAWGLHQKSTDRLFVVSGLVKIVVFDGRRELTDFGTYKRVHREREKSGASIIPPNLYHGWKNIGTSEAIITNMPTRMYSYEEPDALDLPWHSEAAARIVPYRW